MDDPELFLDGFFAAYGTYNGAACLLDVQEGPAPASSGFQPRPGRHAVIYVMAADVDGSPQVHDRIVDADETEWSVQQFTREGAMWLCSCISEQRKPAK